MRVWLQKLVHDAVEFHVKSLVNIVLSARKFLQPTTNITQQLSSVTIENQKAITLRYSNIQTYSRLS